MYPEQNEPEAEAGETRLMWSLGFFPDKIARQESVAVELLHVMHSSVRKVWVEGIEQALLSKNFLKSPSLKEEGGILNKIYNGSWYSFHDSWRGTQ